MSGRGSHITVSGNSKEKVRELGDEGQGVGGGRDALESLASST